MFLHAENLFFLFSLQLVDISIFYVYAVCYILLISVLFFGEKHLVVLNPVSAIAKELFMVYGIFFCRT